MHYTVYDTPVLRFVAYAIGHLWLRAFGWRMEGSPPPAKKFVLIAAPHTSNWDFPFTLAVLFASRRKAYWMGKKEIFRPPFAGFFKWLGGVPVDRDRAHRIATQTIRDFRELDDLIMIIPPEGTRKPVAEWKRGFYLIARGARVPISLGFLDFERKRAGFGPLLELTGDVEADFDTIKAFYANVQGKNPLMFVADPAQGAIEQAERQPAPSPTD